MQFLHISEFLLVAITFLSTTCTGKHKCDHTSKQTSYPPDIPHLVLDPEFVDKFDEVLVIGDVHACLDELQLLLNNSNTAGDNVLKILTGDITRKGPDSVGTIQYIKNNPSIFTVRGNNDQKILERYAKKQKSAIYNYKKPDAFIDDLSEDDLKFLAQLPYTIYLPSLDAYVVHGGIQPGKPVEQNEPYDLMNMRNLVKDKHCPNGYRPYNGEKKGTPWAPLWRGPSFVYFGHDHPRNLQVTPKAIGVDTSCVYGRYLTGIFIKGPRYHELVRQQGLKPYFSH